ncbi:hypothetical protein [Bosea sp. R86505]|uniref:hypothetical protein n=1 Tax=Bosea sp. R86505 TaxID=3101710 RepID=UPI0036718777
MSVASESPPVGLRHIHLALAPETGHPDGERGHGYDLLAPLTQDGRLDPAQWTIDR